MPAEWQNVNGEKLNWTKQLRPQLVGVYFAKLSSFETTQAFTLIISLTMIRE